MFLHDFTYVDLPVTEVLARLADQDGRWLAAIAEAAAREGDELRIRIAPLYVPSILGAKVHVDLGASRRRGDTAVVPLTWSAVRHARAYPVMHADLEVAAMGPGRSQLSVLGRYDLPHGAAGRRPDQLLLHRVAEANIRTFLQGVARALTAAVVA